MDGILCTVLVDVVTRSRTIQANQTDVHLQRIWVATQDLPARSLRDI